MRTSAADVLDHKIMPRNEGSIVVSTMQSIWKLHTWCIAVPTEFQFVSEGGLNYLWFNINLDVALKDLVQCQGVIIWWQAACSIQVSQDML
jgi:hypothetical protein